MSLYSPIYSLVGQQLKPLDRTVTDMVNAVHVHAPDKSSGHRVHELEISYNYIGILPASLLQSVQNAKTA